MNRYTHNYSNFNYYQTTAWHTRYTEFTLLFLYLMLSFVTENNVVSDLYRFTGGFGFTEVNWDTMVDCLALIRPSARACISQCYLHEIPSCFCYVDLHTRGSAGCLGSSLLPEDKIRKTLTSLPAMITIVRLRAQAWPGFMFSNLPHILLTARLKQTTSQSATGLDWLLTDHTCPPPPPKDVPMSIWKFSGTLMAFSIGT